MKKLLPFAFYALVTPAVTLSSGAVIAQQSTDQDADREQQSSQSDRDTTLTTDQDLDHEQRRTQSDQSTTRSTPLTTRNDDETPRAGQSDSRTAADRQSSGDQSRMESQRFMDSVPPNGMHASELIDADVMTASDEDVGSVDDLIIDDNGQVVAIVLGVGGFLGMGQKDVAIGWGHVTRSGTSDDQELRIDVSSEDLRSAPEFESED